MSKLQQYEQAIRRNMASAERDLKDDRDRHGFVIGAVRKLWEVYEAKEIDERQFHHLINLVSTFSGGSYTRLIEGMVSDYEDGNPPIIIGY